MNSSSLRESILLQSAQYICKEQNKIARRFLFKTNKEEDDTIPYTLITKKQSSLFFKRKMNNQVKLAIFDAETMGITNEDLYKLKNYYTAEERIQKGYTSIHYPLDTKFSILDFYNITSKFINIYQVLPDESLKKINPSFKLTYNGNEVTSGITIEGINCITIEFYDDGKAVDYLVEIMTCVSKYEFISYTVYLENYTNTKNVMTFVDGVLVNPSDIETLKSNVEVYTIYDKNIIFNELMYVNTNGYFDFDSYIGLISDKLIFPYGKIVDGVSEYNQYLDDVSKFSEYSENEFSLDNYKDTYVYMVVLGDRNSYYRSSHKLLYDKILRACMYDAECARDILKDTLDDKDSDTKLMMSYPYYYKEELENNIIDDLHISTINYINRSQIIVRNGNYYIRFTFPINSFSFMLFSNGKLITPDIYEETQLDMNIYILASKVLDITGIHDYVIDAPKGLSNLTHDKISRMRYNELGSYSYEDNDVYVHESLNDTNLQHPITIVRSKSFSTEANRYPLTAVPLYVDKSKCRRYSYNPTTKLYELDKNGRYVYYNERYYMISNYEYNYDSISKTFYKSDSGTDTYDGNYFKLITNRFKVPYNKHLEENTNNLLFLNELDDRKLLLEGTLFDRVEANSNYPNAPIGVSNKKYNQVVHAHCNDFLNILCSNPYTKYDGPIFDAKEVNRDPDEYTLYDSYIQQSYRIMRDNLTKQTLDSIINIIITPQYIYYVTDLSYIIHYKNEVTCTCVRYNIENRSIGIMESMDISDVLYVKYDLYNEENQLIISKTDSRVHIDGDDVMPDYEDLIHNALQNSQETMDYDNILIQGRKVYFFKNSGVSFNNNENFMINTIYTYDVINKTFVNEVNKGFIYLEIEYLHSNIYDGQKIVFNRKGYPRAYSDFKTVALYNADVGYSKYYSSGNTEDDTFDIPEQLYYNFDQLMVFANGYLVSDFSVNNSVKILGHVKTSENDVFISNMPKLLLYQTIENLTLWSNMVIEVSSTIGDKVVNQCNNHHVYKKNTDIVHYPLSLKYMLFFVNNIHIDEDHIEIISNQRFMLKNLEDFPEIKKDENGYYIINSINIYAYPGVLHEKYIDYYADSDGNIRKFVHINEESNMRCYEYQLNDQLYDLYRSELISSVYKRCDLITFEADNIKDFKTFVLSDFRYVALKQFTQDDLTRFTHGEYGDNDYLFNKTYEYLEQFTHDQLSKYTHDFNFIEEEDDNNG